MRQSEQTFRRKIEESLDATDKKSDCAACIKFRAQKQDAKSFEREIEVLGYHYHLKNVSYGTPYRMAKKFLHVIGVKGRCIDALLLFGHTPNALRPIPLIPLHIYDNPIESYGQST